MEPAPVPFWGSSSVEGLQLAYVSLAIAALVWAVFWNLSASYSRDAPIINPSRWPLLSQLDAKRAFLTQCGSLMSKARALYPGQPFRLMTDVCEVLVLPPSFANEIRNNPNLNLSRAAFVDFHGDIPGFALTKLTEYNYILVQSVTQKQLTKSLSTLTKPLSTEATHALLVNLGPSQEWREVTIKPILLDIVARLSSRVFLGEDLCRNEKWLETTKEYTISMFVAAAELRMWPRLTRKIVHWFLPKCRKLRRQFAHARSIVTAVIQERKNSKQADRIAGRSRPEYNDALEWAEHEAEKANASYDEAKFQLVLSVAALHTTTDLFLQVIIDLAQHQEIFQPLRQEIVQCVRAGGWQKNTLYNMKLLDSVIKETQRMKPGSITSMRRYVDKDVILSNGFRLRKGTRVSVDSCRMRDPELYQNPDQWDGYRFFKLRSQEGMESGAQLVSTSPDHLAFGHGQHACPGRFFAANEIKIALSHMLLKYDWKLAPGTNVAPIMNGIAAIANPTTKLLFRRRTEMELDIDSF